MRRLVGRRHLTLSSLGLSTALIAAETVLVCCIAVATGASWHGLAYGDAGPFGTFAAIGLLAALLAVLPFVGTGDFEASAFLAGRRTASRVLVRWHAGLLLLGAVGFLTKTTAVFSRGWLVLFWLAGIVGLLALNSLAGWLVKLGIERGRVVPRRLMLVGTEREVAGFWARRGAVEREDRVVSVARLPAAGALAAGERDSEVARILAEAVEHARVFSVDAVVLLAGAEPDAIVAPALDAFSVLPVTVHLDAGPALDAHPAARIERFGHVSALTLTDPPLGTLGALGKRCFDCVAAVLGLVALAPLFAVVALLIKLDSRGPVFFRQRRRGYNQREFRIVKFRTMTTLDDGDVVRQARSNDPRITRVGAVLRRYNIDELPQLVNVLAGEMSIVGPRPHAVAHDRLFEKRIVRYPRRLNVKPGITGWAQVNGFRGETETDDKMALRVDHDLYYIDHWSIWFDLYIVALTVLSPRAFANAR